MAYTNPSITASGTTFAQLQAGGVSGHLEKLIAAQAATLAPTVAATAAATGGGASGGLLAAGTYYFVVTESNGIGETTAGPESAQLTVGATNIPRVTFQTLKAGNVSRSIYLGAVGGSTGGPYSLYAQGITAATYDLAVAAPSGSSAVRPPTINTTAFAAAGGTVNQALQMIRAFEDGGGSNVYRFLTSVITTFNQGEPMSFSGTMAEFRHAHTVFAMLATLCAEEGTLIDANPGHFVSPVPTNPIGVPKPKRVWP